MSAQAEDLGARAFFGAEVTVPLGSVEHDWGNVGQSLYVVDNSWLGVKPDLSWERRAVTRLA